MLYRRDLMTGNDSFATIMSPLRGFLRMIINYEEVNGFTQRIVHAKINYELKIMKTRSFREVETPELNYRIYTD